MPKLKKGVGYQEIGVYWPYLFERRGNPEKRDVLLQHLKHTKYSRDDDKIQIRDVFLPLRQSLQGARKQISHYTVTCIAQVKSEDSL